MTVENTQNKMPPLQMGTTNEYPFNFAVLLQDPTAEEALEAIKASVLQADGTEIELVYNTDYTVTLNTDRIGGTLTVNDIRTSGDYITIYRQYAQTQEVDYKDFNSAPAETFEQCFDKLTMLSQQQQEEINRSIKLPVSSDITNLSLPNPVAGRTLKWNESETGLINSDVSIDEIDDSVQAALEASINAKQQAEIASDAAKEVVEKVSEVDNIWSEIVEGNMFKLQIFDTVVKDHILTYEESQGLALQGTYVYKDAIAGSRYGYADFYNKVLEEYNEATETETVNEVTVKVNSNGHKFYNIADKASIDAFYNTMGTAWFYGIDTENERIFLPRDKYFAIKGNVPVAGNGMTLGLMGQNGATYGLTNCNSQQVTVNIVGKYYGSASGTSADTWGQSLPSATLGVTTDPTKSGIEAHIEANEDKYLYICVGNTVSDTSWVDIVTQVQGGVKDLEEATNEGLQALSNASNALRQNQITNCLLEVPQNIKLELNNGTLTLKAGSIVTVPNGFEADGTTPKFDYVTIENDLGNNYTSSGGYGSWLVYYNKHSNVINIREVSHSFSGTTEPTGVYTFWYNMTTNTINNHEGEGSGWGGLMSLPVAEVTLSSTGWTSIDQVFNGIGYIGSTVWVDKGVKVLIPNGRNEDGTLNNVEHTTQTLLTYTNADGLSMPLWYVIPTNRLLFNSSTDYWTYNTSKNCWEHGNDVNYFAIVAQSNTTSGKITNFQPKQPFRAVDYNELKSYIVETYVNGTSWYRVWSDGWCEQGGVSSNASAGNAATVTFLKPFKDTNYTIVGQAVESGTTLRNGSTTDILSKTANSVKIGIYGGSASNNWMASGYIA